MTVLGIDPGHRNGAAVVLHADGRFVALLGWVKRAAYWDIESVCTLSGKRLRVTEFGALCDEVRMLGALHGVTHAAVEGLAYGRRQGEGRSTKSIVTLAEAAGALASAAEQATSRRALRPLCAAWRKKVLKLTPQTPAESAKAAAMAAVGGLAVRRRLSVRLTCTLPERWAAIDHAAEAACIAEYARSSR